MEENSNSKFVKQSDAVYDARTLGVPKMLLLGFQHMFAMFGATVLVPALTGLSVSATLLFAGAGTLLFHLISKRKVPAFLGSSFAFIGAYATVASMEEAQLVSNPLVYACVGVACAGLLYLVMALLVRVFGTDTVLKFFPPVVTGPLIIAIGLSFSGSAVKNCNANWGIAFAAILIVILCNIFGKGMIKVVPILIGILSGYALTGVLNFFTTETVEIAGQGSYYAMFGSEHLRLFSVEAVENIKAAPWIGLPFKLEDTAFSLIGAKDFNGTLLLSAIITIVPIALATIVEHIGDISAISSTVGENFIDDPGLHRTLTGDGLATTLASLFGAPANTTYGENTGVLSLSKVYDPRVIRLAAIFAIVFSFSPKFAAVIGAIPPGVLGGISLELYGMISAIGVRNVVENHIDFSNIRNVIIAAMIMVLSIGIAYGTVDGYIPVGPFHLTGLATGSVAGILLNAVLPRGKES